ncbi:hypothetical protein Tco_1111721 [Tanacetum coccineum]|uniref:Uncharacterized protein n=1 Tax=Tanacetum coccineum TaxID=301880 RepID=A0ABQ5IQA2_9ASTR
MIVGFEESLHGPSDAVYTIPSHSSFSQKILVSFVTEIHTSTIDISLRDLSISNSTAIGDMDNLVKDQTCDNWKSNAINDLTGNMKIVVAYLYGNTVRINGSPIFGCYPYLYGNLDIGTAVEYQKYLLASLGVSALDKPYNSDYQELPQSHQDQVTRSLKSNKELFYEEIVIFDEIWEIASFQVMYEHDGRQEMMQDLKISELKVKRRSLKIKDHKA